VKKPVPTHFFGLSLLFDPDVYEPSDDSELMVEAARKHSTGLVLDMGCGTGVFGIASAAKKEVSCVVCADINPAAIALAKKNAALNGVEKKMSFVQTDLFSAFSASSATAEKFDVIGFNPPYLPTEKDEVVKGALNKAFDGGLSGRETTDDFLASFENFLAQDGILILLQSSLSNSGKTVAALEKKGFAVETVSSRKFFFEEICVLVAKRKIGGKRRTKGR
jgi:release factor glutamine methyltransferase